MERIDEWEKREKTLKYLDEKMARLQEEVVALDKEEEILKQAMIKDAAEEKLMDHFAQSVEMFEERAVLSEKIKKVSDEMEAMG